MTLLARPCTQTQQEPRRVRIQARDPHFFRAFAQGYALRQQEEGSGLPLTDDALYGLIRRVMIRPELSPAWKAGLVTGSFAALYHLPCRFEGSEHAPTLLVPVQTRPIELFYADPHFPTAYEAGSQAFAAVTGSQPATAEGLYAELVRDFCPHATLSEARWCAGYLAGFLAALFRVPCFVEEWNAAREPVRIERRCMP